jgi:hypothetical protein
MLRLVILFFLSMDYCLSQSPISVGATSHWTFGIDDNLSIIWKMPYAGFDIVCTGGDYFMAIKPGHDSSKVFGARIADGSIAWSASLRGIPEGLVTSTDSTLGACVLLKLDVGDSIRSELRQLSTGKIYRATSDLRSNRTQASVCPLGSPADTLEFFQTSTNVSSISPDLSIIWHQKLEANEYLGATYHRFGFLVGKNHIRTLDQNSGRELWKRAFDKNIQQIWYGSTLVISFKNGTIDSLNAEDGISRTRY